MPIKKKSSKIEPAVSSRPPIVTIMGHVDHGKTTLLDALRKTNVAESEFGGITQKIGAYQVEVDTKEGKKKITFIDTPGHEVFAKMRRRGAQVTDIAVIVIDAVDGVMPQTLESVKHCQKASVPFLIALNKTDLPDALPEKVKKQLSKENILVEGLGGDIICVEISAKTQKSLPQLLEMILLLSEMAEIKSAPNDPLDAVIIESNMDKHQGPVASVIIKNGTLKSGQEVFACRIHGKVRALKNDKGQTLDSAGPGTPVKIYGLEKVPKVGEKLTEKIKEDKTKMNSESLPLELKLPEEKTQKLNILLKVDSAGSLEAIEKSLPLETIEIISQGIGEINESDVLSAKASRAIVIGFNVKTSSSAKKLAESEKILINSYKIIYELLDDVLDAASFIGVEKETEKVLGKAKIIAEFPGDKYTIIGCKVTEGRLAKNDTTRIVRDEETVSHAKIASMKHGKDDIQKADLNMEFGLITVPQVDFRIGDMIISYRKLQ